jgi:glucose-1-phosphate thymidylyltransferase
MEKASVKIVIPMAGLGTRLRPHTWSKPKQLVSVAGKAMLGHVMDTFDSLPEALDVEFIFIVGYLGGRMRPFMDEHYPHRKVNYVVQENPKGQSHAIYMAKDYLSGPMLMVFADTLIETDLSFLAEEAAEAVAWVRPVEDPRRFGVAEVDDEGRVRRLIEKPDSMENDLAVVGFYYFQDSAALLGAIEEQMRRDVQLKGEYFLADAVNIMLEGGLHMRTEKVETWLDAGTPEALLETNRYLLNNGRGNTESAARREGIVVIQPVFIHPEAEVESSVIGPYASLGAGCRVERSVVRDSIVEDGAQIRGAVLERSLLGERAIVQGRTSIINAGDDAEMTL